MVIRRRNCGVGVLSEVYDKLKLAKEAISMQVYDSYTRLTFSHLISYMLERLRADPPKAIDIRDHMFKEHFHPRGKPRGYDARMLRGERNPLYDSHQDLDESLDRKERVAKQEEELSNRKLQDGELNVFDYPEIIK